MDIILSGIIGSKIRIKLLVRLFFNPQTRSYLREQAKELGISNNAVQQELNQLEKTNLLKSEKMVAKVMGIDQVLDGIVSRLEKLERAYLLGDYAEGKDSGIIDLLLVGNIDPYHLSDLSGKLNII